MKMKVLKRIVRYLQYHQCVHPSSNKAFISLSAQYSSASQTAHSTIDNEEVSNFKNFVNSWWDELGELKALHSLNNLRVPFIRDGLKNNGKLQLEHAETSKPLTNLHILDIGCGGGILSEPLARLGANVTGVDASKDVLKCAEIHTNQDLTVKDNITYIHSSVEDLCDKHKEAFDAVVASEVIEHISAKDLFLSSCVQVLKPGGSLFFSTINKTALSWVFDIIAAEYILNIVPRGTHDWDKFISPYKLQKILENYDCRTKLIHGMIYIPVYNKWCWMSDKSMNYVLHAVKKDTQ